MITRIAVLVLAVAALEASAQQAAPLPGPGAVEGFPWKLEMQNIATNEVRTFSFNSTGTFPLSLSPEERKGNDSAGKAPHVGTVRCWVAIDPAQKTKLERVQRAALWCGDGNLATATAAFCGEMVSSEMTSIGVTVAVTGPKGELRSELMRLRCVNGVP